MARRDDIVAFLDEYLEAHEIRDYCPQGLQVEGVPEIDRVALGVTADLEFLRRAKEGGAQMLLVHHGLFWDGEPRTLIGMRRERVRFLLQHELNLVAYHLPLDRHPESGNNAQIAKHLGANDLKPFGRISGVPIGIRARFDPPLRLPEVLKRIREGLKVEEKAVLSHGPEMVREFGVISGGATRMVQEAVDEHLDLYLTGELDFTTAASCRESNMNYISLGHHDSETLGVQALGCLLEERFGLHTEYIDLPNPL